MKKNIIIYHGECRDGFGGAWAAWKKLGDKAEYLGIKYGDALPKSLKSREVYLIDFSFKEPMMKKYLSEAKKIVALDHHVSAEKTTKMAQEYVYALDHSGAVIAWNYFHPRKKVPQLLCYIEDMDLWKFKLPNAEEITSYLQLYDYSFENFDRLAKELESASSRKKCVTRGKDILFYEQKMVERLLKGAELAEFAGYKTLVLNSPVLQSQAGAAIVKKLPPIGVVWREKNGIIAVSLRSNGKVDVAKIATKFGGGGHKAASGFELKIGQKFPWKIL